MIDTRNSNTGEDQRILSLQEDHFNDLKSKRVAPSKLQETFVAFANSDGGELYIGVEDPKTIGERIIGFSSFSFAARPLPTRVLTSTGFILMAFTRISTSPSFIDGIGKSV